MTYKTGSIGEFMKWTQRVVADPAAAESISKRWFEDEATAARALGAATSPEAMVKLLSEENLGLLRLIVVNKPRSMQELAKLAHRKESNLSRTLRKLHEAGIVDFEKGRGRTRIPRVTARRVTLELDLVGQGGAVSVDRPFAPRQGGR
jgi:predicted transcriptional regulator